MAEEPKLFEQFPPVPTRDWMELVERDLKGADFDKRLVWDTGNGFKLMPFYRREDIDSISYIDSMPGNFPYIRGSIKKDNSWLIRQDIVVNGFEEANKKALYLLNRGIDSLGFRFRKDETFAEGNLDKLLDSVFLESVELNLIPDGNAMELLVALKSSVESRGLKADLLNGSIETDMLGRLMTEGKLCTAVDKGFDWLAKLTSEASKFNRIRTINVNGSILADAGASIVQELAISIAMGSEYMAAMNERGIEAGISADTIKFTFGIGSNYFMEIAKLRAARLLWAMIVKKYNPGSESRLNIYQHAVTTRWNKTLYDPWVNILRTQTEAMSATLGGVNSLTILPYDIAGGEGTDLSERIARNQQLLLREEAYFGKVNDPGAGSYYIEKITASVAESAWDLFTDIEEKGGFVQTLKDGFLQSLIRETSLERIEKINRGKAKVLGTNIYPNRKERVDRKVEKTGETVNGNWEIEPITIRRATEDIENLRLSTDNSGFRPKVYLLITGDPLMSKARAQFSSDFFSVAGYEIIESHANQDIEKLIKSANESGANIVVICSSDDEYPDLVPGVIKGVKKDTILVVAGEPECKPGLQDAGVEHFISVRSCLLANLMKFNSILGIKMNEY